MVNFMTEYVGEKKAWSIVYGIFGVIAAILFFLCFAGCKERIHENEEEKTEKIRVIDGVKAVLKNKYWHMLMVISICINIFFQAISAVNTYYSKAVLHNSSMISVLNTAYIVPAIVTFFFVHLVVKKYGKGKTTMFGWIIICVSYVILLPFTENTTVLIITAAMRGIGYVMTVGGVTFKRYLEIAQTLNKETAVVTDNDGNIEAVKKKYKEYEEIQCIHICVDEVVDTGDLKLSDKDFNYNTLEPKILKENGREAMNNIFGTNYDTDDEMHKYMHAHKTDCAIAIFESATKIKYPEYIMRAIKNE